MSQELEVELAVVDFQKSILAGVILNLVGRALISLSRYDHELHLTQKNKTLGNRMDLVLFRPCVLRSSTH